MSQVTFRSREISHAGTLNLAIFQVIITAERDGWTLFFFQFYIRMYILYNIYKHGGYLFSLELTFKVIRFMDNASELY